MTDGNVNALDPAVWPLSARRADGVFSLGGIPVTDLVAEHGTPAMFLDEHDLRSRARAYANASEEVSVNYAGKAFLCSTVARWVADEGLGLDVCTGGELAVALAAGLPGEVLALHGNNKSRSELERAVAAGVGRIIVDSFEEIDRLTDIVGDGTQRVLVRVTVGVEAHTHEYVATAHEDQKFGFSLRDGSAAKAAAAVLGTANLDLVGLHAHIGSQMFDMSAFDVATQRLVELAAELHESHDVELAELNLGGGLGIAYVDGEDPLTPQQIVDRLQSIVARECAAAVLRQPRLAIEPGRSIAGPGTITVYEVGTVKRVSLDGGEVRTYVSVDGGMSDNIRTALYDAEYTCTLAGRESDAAPVRSRIVGKHCESGDIVVRDAWLPGDVAPGDLLAVAATGAYCRSMASNYNHVPRPPVIGVRDGQSTVLVRRETEDDLLRLDAGVPA